MSLMVAAMVRMLVRMTATSAQFDQAGQSSVGPVRFMRG